MVALGDCVVGRSFNGWVERENTKLYVFVEYLNINLYVYCNNLLGISIKFQ